MSSYQFDIQALNDICVDNGAAGAHVYDINALNAWAVAIGGLGGHTYNINALNEIVGLLGGAGAPFLRNIDALNSISVVVGGTGGYRFDIDALNELADLDTGSGPDAPVLTWVSDNTVNPPIFDAVFDNTHVWSAAEITGSNFDRIELQIDDDVAFGSFADVTNDLDATELTNLVAVMNPGAQATGVPLYARVRHIHYTGGVGHPSDWSNVETKTLAVAPANTVAPVVSGNTQVGQTLTTTDGTWTGTATITFTYQWKRNGSSIGGATNGTYILTVADAGQAITCSVTGTNGVGNATAGSNTLTIDAVQFAISGAYVSSSVTRQYAIPGAYIVERAG